MMPVTEYHITIVPLLDNTDMGIIANRGFLFLSFLGVIGYLAKSLSDNVFRKIQMLNLIFQIYPPRITGDMMGGVRNGRMTCLRHICLT